jgi:hypothetical protein
VVWLNDATPLTGVVRANTVVIIAERMKLIRHVYVSYFDWVWLLGGLTADWRLVDLRVGSEYRDSSTVPDEVVNRFGRDDGLCGVSGNVGVFRLGGSNGMGGWNVSGSFTPFRMTA